MSELCKTNCEFYATCNERGAEDPAAYTTARRQMMPTDGLHSPQQIETAQELAAQADECTSENPGSPMDCNVAAEAVIRSLIG